MYISSPQACEARGCDWALDGISPVFGRGYDTFGNPYRARIYKLELFELFELLLLSNFDKQPSVEQFGAAASQSAAPSPPSQVCRRPWPRRKVDNIHVYVCVCVCMCMYMYVYVYVCIYIYICIYVYTYIYVYIHTYIHTCICTQYY